MNIVADIRRVMREKGVAQAELARTLGMSPSQLSSILRDEDYNFTVKMLRRFAAALETDLSVALGDTEVAATPRASGGVVGSVSVGGVEMVPKVTAPRGGISYTSGEKSMEVIVNVHSNVDEVIDETLDRIRAARVWSDGGMVR